MNALQEGIKGVVSFKKCLNGEIYKVLLTKM
jgi:hypothetical protein